MCDRNNGHQWSAGPFSCTNGPPAHGGIVKKLFARIGESVHVDDIVCPLRCKFIVECERAFFSSQLKLNLKNKIFHDIIILCAMTT